MSSYREIHESGEIGNNSREDSPDVIISLDTLVNKDDKEKQIIRFSSLKK